MRALSIHPAAISLIATGEKSIKVRSWRTDHRGPLLLCGTARGDEASAGKAAMVVDVVDCRPLRLADADAAGYREVTSGATEADCSGWWAWVLSNPRPLARPFPVRGRQGLYDVEVPA